MTSPGEFQCRKISGLSEVKPAAWNALGNGNPLIRHEFLHALELSGCVGPETAWHPQHLILETTSGELVGAMPLYLKYDSRGEFVFDWSWADAYERAGFEYYPKLLSAVPFTPAGGNRLLAHPDHDQDTIRQRLIDEALKLARELELSSLHLLFPAGDELATLNNSGMLARKDCQFHWTNAGFSNFDEFLGCFSSAKRKKAKRERRRIAEAGISFDHLSGHELLGKDWDAIFEFYSHTFLRRGRLPYLNREFFEQICSTMPENLMTIVARFDHQPIATAICFRSATALYGRYWGSAADFHSLHFETCYYQGIEYCIREGLSLFEPGTQGEHKISRGFRPTTTWSYHWLAQSAFYEAIEDYLERESAHVDDYMAHWDQHLPYRRDESGLPPKS